MSQSNNFDRKTDEELVQLTIQDQENFLYLMNRYEKKLLFFIMRISGVSNEEAEDTLQEVFIKCYKNINSFNNKLKFSSWIYQIARNESISAYRKRDARKENMKIELSDIVSNKIASELTADKDIDVKYLNKNIYQVLNNLKSKYREVLILRYFEDQDYEEMADILKKPKGTVATLLNRAKRDFRKEIEKQEIKF